jgi:hypothetical protein
MFGRNTCRLLYLFLTKEKKNEGDGYEERTEKR